MLKTSKTVTARKSLPSSRSAAEKENERLRKRIAELEKEKQSKPKQVAKRSPSKKVPQLKVGSTGSGSLSLNSVTYSRMNMFFVSVVQ